MNCSILFAKKQENFYTKENINVLCAVAIAETIKAYILLIIKPFALTVIKGD